jgi:multiple sugar transport system substrate-binding protein
MFASLRTARVAAAGAAILISSLAVAGCAATQAPEPGATYNPDEEVTLDFVFWGNDVRADLYNEAIAVFNEEYPNITVNTSFLGWDEYWEKRQTEAAGGGLPDVMQTDINFLRQYAENGLLLDLDPYLDSIIDTEPLPENVLGIAVLNDETVGIPISTNAWAMFENPTLIDELGVEAFPGGDWEAYDQWLRDVRETADSEGMEVWGGSNYTGFIQSFEVMLRAQGKDLFTEDGEPGFTREDLKAFWEMGTPLIEEGIVIPQQRLEELSPLSGFDSARQLTELTWDNYGAGYLANLGENYPVLNLVEPPVTVEGSADLYKKAGMLLSGAATTDHPEAVAAYIDFMVNSPDVAAIFGTNRGLPASETALAGVPMDETTTQIIEYEESIADRLGDAPPLPIVGYGTLEAKFKQLGQEFGFQTISVDEAVDQFFAEMDVVLNQ